MNTGALSKSIFLFLLSVLIVCTNAFAEGKKVKKGAVITYKGNVIQLGPGSKKDTAYYKNPKTGKQEMKITAADSIPVLINGEKVLTDMEIDAAPSGEESILGMIVKLINKNQPAFDHLPNGNYLIDINQVVIGRNGRVQYYKFDGLRSSDKGISISSNKNVQVVNKLIDDLISSDDLFFEPGNKNGVRVTCMSKNMDSNIRLKVANGVSSLLP